MKQTPFLRIAPWLILVVVAYAAGRWQRGAAPRTEKAPTPPPEAASAPDATPKAAPETASTDRAPRVVAEAEEIANAAKKMSTPDARTYAFFEKLQPADIEPVFDFVEKMPAGNEQDLLFALAAHRWGQLDGATAVTRTARFPALATRLSGQLAAFEAWGAHDADAAFARALKETNELAQARALTAVLSGAATVDPRAALALWQTAPESFRKNQAGLAAAGQIISAACGTGRRDVAQAIIAEQSAGDLRTQMIDTLAREWGAHDPDHAYEWIQTVLPAGEDRDSVVNNMFTALAHKDPARAAAWGAAFPDERRQLAFIAAAVAEWAPLDSDGAETWVNEQPSSRALDGASYAIAAHFLSQHDMERSFAWIRRITQPEARSEMFGNLGRVWSQESPAEFKKFVDKTSLNPVELKMLFAKIGPAP
jgi:hypothetical protein